MTQKQFKLGDRVRVKPTAPRHHGKIGYVDFIGEGPASGTVIMCTENRHHIQDPKDFRISAAILFAAYSDDIELITSN